MKYDQVDAFFSGLFSGPVRVVFGLATMWLVLAVCLQVADELDIEFDGWIFAFVRVVVTSAMGTIFYWADYGTWVVLGMFLFVAQWGAFYAFIVSEDTKIWWFMLSFFSTALCLPLAFNGPWWMIICGFAVLSVFYWLPELIVVYRNKH